METKVFLTGVTGFVGKVVLEELIRRQEEFGFKTIYVLIRPHKRKGTSYKRFQNEVVSSPCFSKLPPNWHQSVEVISGELIEKGCGMSGADRTLLSEEVTHIINCAASVEFDLPVAEAASCNIKSSLNVLEFAKTCQQLQSMVNVSTAYVAPFRGRTKTIGEDLVPLPRPASEIYQDILEGKKTDKEFLKETGHPNTYTFTKCLSEHLLTENRGNVPLSFVRPSIISSCWRYPFPSWIDSRAAFAGFVALIGSGRLRAVVAQYTTYLDVVPCDEVVSRILHSAFSSTPSSKPIIRHAACGLKVSSRIDLCINTIEDFFRRHRVDRYPHLKYVGAHNFRFKVRHWWHHHAPAFIFRSWLGLTGEKKKKRMVTRLIEQLDYLNAGFPYFTHNSFDFYSSMPLDHPDFKPKEYIETVCRGVYRYLMKRDETEMLLGGRDHREEMNDLGWTARQPKGNWVVRLFAYVVRKGLRKCTSKVTFDRPAFESARVAASKESLLVLVPTHRSYLDFILCSYLFFAHSDLGISIPHIAAAKEFSKIPILGWLFRKTHAFYVSRGLGRENKDLTKEVHRLVSQKHTLEFFIEGTRSRSRQLLKPRRGILKCLQSTNQKFSILPVAITYDRVPEEAAFMRELKGGPKPRMRLSILVGWLWRLFRGKIDIGHIHVTCGKPLPLDATTDVNQLSRDVMAQLQVRMATTTHHLRCFLKHSPIEGIDFEWLKAAVVQRGGQVIDSPLTEEELVDPMVEKSMRYQWMHLFYHEARALFPNHPVIHHHIVTNSFYPLNQFGFAAEVEDPKVRRLLRALFEPVCHDYWTVAKLLKPSIQKEITPSPLDIVRQKTNAHLPTLEAAFEDLVSREILLPRDKEEGYTWGPRAKEIEDYQAQCEWPVDVDHPM